MDWRSARGIRRSFGRAPCPGPARRPTPAYRQYSRRLPPHHGDLGSGIREIDVGAKMLRSHHAVGAAIRFSRDHCDFRDGGLGERVEELGAVPDNAPELLACTRKESGYILESEQGNVERVA